MTGAPLCYCYAVAAASVSCAHLLDYSLKVTSRKTVQHATREENPWQWSRVFLEDLLISKDLWPPLSPDFCFLDFFSWGYLKEWLFPHKPRKLTQWKIILEIKSGKLTAWHWDAVSIPDVPGGDWWSPSAHGVMSFFSTWNKVCVLSILSHFVYSFVIFI